MNENVFAFHSGGDPQRAAARCARAPLPRRFYEMVEIAEGEGGFAVRLDGKGARTPGRRALVLPVRPLAEAIAAEWTGQGERLDPTTMPLTRLANAAIDGAAREMAAVEAEIVKYAGSDLICYRAGAPASLARAQGEAWDPLIALARDKLGAKLAVAEGIVFMAQAEEAVAAVARAVRAAVASDLAAPFRLAALHEMTALTGSCVIALAIARGELDLDAGWAAAHVDEDFQMNAWGRDEEALSRRASRFVEMRAAARVSGLLARPVAQT